MVDMALLESVLDFMEVDFMEEQQYPIVVMESMVGLLHLGTALMANIQAEEEQVLVAVLMVRD